MSEDETEPDVVESVGPIQMLSIAFEGNQFHGEILPELERLKRDGIVRIIDLLLVRKDSEGAVMVTTQSDLEWEEAVSFGSFFGSLAGYANEGPEGFDRGALPAVGSAGIRSAVPGRRRTGGGRGCGRRESPRRA